MPQREANGECRNPAQFTVLVVEDVPGTRNDIVARLERIPDVTVLEAGSKEDAVAAIKRHHIDAATVDIELDETSGGFDVLAHLGHQCRHAGVVIVTQHARAHQGQILLNFVGKTSPRVIRVIDKNKEAPADAAEPIAREVERWRSGAVAVENGELLVDLLVERGGSRAEYQGLLRSCRAELTIELDRAYRDLFGGIQQTADGAQPTVAFEPIERQGFSSAITVMAFVTLGNDAAGTPVHGSQCVVKVGPVTVIQEEVNRYNHFVKYGVRLAERVELLANTERDGFAAVVYSFAGGVFGEALLTLDEVLAGEDGYALAEEAFLRLFRRTENNWYSVKCEAEPPAKFIDTTKVPEAYELLHKGLRNLQGQFRTHGYAVSEADEDRDGSFAFPGGKLTIPTMRIAGGHDLISPSRPRCFVHGDMHGGNVMVELSGSNDCGWRLRRVCLIDYRRAGAGPRPIDAIALQASLRLADAQDICNEVTGKRGAIPAGDDLATAVDLAARRTFAEAEMLKDVWDQGAPVEVKVEEGRESSWASSALLIARLTRLNFRDMPMEEYLATAVPSGVRQFRYRLGPVGRVRMLAWVSAMWEAVSGHHVADEIAAGARPD